INQLLANTLTGAERALYQLNKWTEAETYFAAELNELARMKTGMCSGQGFGRLLTPWRRLKLAARLVALLIQADLYKADVMKRAEERDRGAVRRLARSKWSALLRLLRHPRTQSTVSFLVLPDRTLVARAGWRSIDFAIRRVTRLQLRELLSEYHKAVQAEETTRAAAVLRTLSDALQMPELLRTLPAHVRTITFVPDDILHGLPFAALTYETDERPANADTARSAKYLAEDFTITVSYEWLPTMGRRARARTALTVSVPHGTQELAPLPWADNERRKVLAWLTKMGVEAVDLPEPDKRELLRRLPEARFFHIACHGQFRPDAPTESGLVLVSAQGAASLISLRELAQLDLSCMDLAVLSSCWSADNFILPGRWIISLSETFWRAGARTVLSSL
ncbi:MAG TPA: CHAT domain-containing protein, partial [Pyrinomonadaceae bacterium]|nr:CHAT domain-containing protein [Pyrinomonadaceae bacterium]